MAVRPRSRASRRYQERVRKQRRERRVRTTLDSLELVEPRLRFRVTVPLTIAQPEMREQARDIFLAALRAHASGLESVAKVAEPGVVVVLELEAEDDPAARSKALYWCELAARRSRMLRWNPVPRDHLTVEAL